jgi:hypothetical protein
MLYSLGYRECFIYIVYDTVRNKMNGLGKVDRGVIISVNTASGHTSILILKNTLNNFEMIPSICVDCKVYGLWLFGMIWVQLENTSLNMFYVYIIRIFIYL